MKRSLIACVLVAQPLPAGAEEAFLVKDGVPLSEIVVTEDPPRSTRLAARELRSYLKKLSGAQLNIVTQPSGRVPVRIYVGQSSHTQALGISARGLEGGAYRTVSGDNWLALLGDDTDFVPIEPWPRNNNDIASGKMQAAWNRITGKHWGYTHSQLHKHYTGPNSLFGTPDEQPFDKEGNVHVWTYDERGSFNAVCGFLRDLGVRWYMPGELGEVVPVTKTIRLPAVDKTVRPDFPMRILNFRASVYGRDVAMWGFRLGVRQPFGRQAAHGLDRMTNNEHTLSHHPEWFALYGGQRHTQPGLRQHQLCYSNEELLQEAVAFARAQFDHYDMDVVSIMPPDGYTAICQCKLCAGKDSPELGYRGSLSNYVWDFVNRVAKEVRKTHPDKKISNCAYGVYTAPPSNIDKLEPNVQVIIVGGRRPTQADRHELRRLRDAWAAKTDNPLEIFENYPFTGRGFYLPAYIPRVMGESINATKGISRGEDIWLTMDFGEDAVGYNHFLAYFTARMYWGGRQRDVVAMFDEYCRLFYGPASDEMRAFFDYCQTHWREMERSSVVASRALKLFSTAKSKAPRDSVYGKRIQLIDNYLNGLRNKSVQLAQRRGPVPRLRLVSGSRGRIVIDGKLDDQPWRECPVASTGRMAELQTGRQPIFGSSIKTAWIGNDLYFAIRCEERLGSKPNIATRKSGDPAIWYGDVVEILLDTESHSYYQIAVNPAGALIDLDRGANRSNWFNWSSQAEAAALVAEDHWTVEIRIPVTQDKNDPLHQVVGRKPTQSLPWHINVCRQRIREDGSEYSAFSPTGTSGFHKPMKFAHFYAGRSHRFPADPTVTDYLIASRAASESLRQRKYEEALARFEALCGGDVTDLQQSAALEQAILAAYRLDDSHRASQLIERIPIDAVAKSAKMNHLLHERKAADVIAAFASEDIGSWPFWKRGAGYFARGRAYAATRAGEQAEADLLRAREWTSDQRTLQSIRLALGNCRERLLQNDPGALQAYREILDPPRKLGGADEFAAVQGAARILCRSGKFDEALAAIDLAEIKGLQGHWRHAMLLTLGDTLRAAGRDKQALAAYAKVLADHAASASARKAAESAAKTISKAHK